MNTQRVYRLGNPGNQSDSINEQEQKETDIFKLKKEQLLFATSESNIDPQKLFVYVDETETILDNKKPKPTKDTVSSFMKNADKSSRKSEKITTKIYDSDETSRQADTMDETSTKIEALIDIAEGNWLCRVCPFNSKEKCKLKEHVQTHMDLEFPCTLCGKIVR